MRKPKGALELSVMDTEGDQSEAASRGRRGAYRGSFWRRRERRSWHAEEEPKPL